MRFRGGEASRGGRGAGIRAAAAASESESIPGSRELLEHPGPGGTGADLGLRPGSPRAQGLSERSAS